MMPEFDRAVSILWRAATIGFAVALVVLVAIAAVFAVPQLVGGDQSYVVMSGSMEPAISAGDVIVVESVAIGNVRLGDVVTFDRGEQFPTTHRVVEIEGTGSEVRLVTQGDANEDADPEFVGDAQLVGRVQSIGGHLVVIPSFGHVIQFANTAGGMVLLVFLPLLLFVLNEVYLRLGEPDDADEDVTGTGGPDEAVELPDQTGVTDLSSDSIGGATVGGLDLTLTLVVLAIVVPYSGLMLVEHRQPLSAMVFAGGLVGFLLIAGQQLWIWYESRQAGPSEPVASTDGGSAVAVDEATSVGHERGDDR
jgi:signal peptidase